MYSDKALYKKRDIDPISNKISKKNILKSNPNTICLKQDMNLGSLPTFKSSWILQKKTINENNKTIKNYYENPKNLGVIQRALSAQNPKNYSELTTSTASRWYSDTPISNVSQEHCESVGAKGDFSGSYTGNFKHTGLTGYIEESEVAIGGWVVGYLYTVPKDDGMGAPMKCHLVNHELNAKANDWENNWVWGSAKTNTRHKEFESKGKQNMPSNSTGIISLNYKTSVASSSVNYKNPTLQEDINANANSVRGANAYTPPTDNQWNITVTTPTGNADVHRDAFQNSWKAALGKVAKTLYVELRATKDKESWNVPIVGGTTQDPNQTWRLVYLPRFNQAAEMKKRYQEAGLIA